MNKRDKIIATMIVVLVVLLLIYTIFGFILLQFNPVDWELKHRAVMITLWGIICLYIAGIIWQK